MSSNFTIRTLTRSIDHYPMHHLFSPTALDHDLTYVDKTYYNASQNLASNSITKPTNEKQSGLGVQAIVLNRTISLVTSISRLDL
jgi:hypothetical protein